MPVPPTELSVTQRHSSRHRFTLQAECQVQAYRMRQRAQPQLDSVSKVVGHKELAHVEYVPRRRRSGFATRCSVRDPDVAGIEVQGHLAPLPFVYTTTAGSTPARTGISPRGRRAAWASTPRLLGTWSSPGRNTPVWS